MWLQVDTQQSPSLPVLALSCCPDKIPSFIRKLSPLVWNYVTRTYRGGQSPTRPRCRYLQGIYTKLWKKKSSCGGSVPASRRASLTMRMNTLFLYLCSHPPLLVQAALCTHGAWNLQAGPQASSPRPSLLLALAALGCWTGKSNISVRAARHPSLSFLAVESSTLTPFTHHISFQIHLTYSS